MPRLHYPVPTWYSICSLYDNVVRLALGLAAAGAGAAGGAAAAAGAGAGAGAAAGGSAFPFLPPFLPPAAAGAAAALPLPPACPECSKSAAERPRLSVRRAVPPATRRMWVASREAAKAWGRRAGGWMLLCRTPPHTEEPQQAVALHGWDWYTLHVSWLKQAAAQVGCAP